jgi:hypothetical protein
MSFIIIFPPLPSALPIQGSQAATSRRPVPSPRNAYDFLGIATGGSPAGVASRNQANAPKHSPWDQRLRPPIFRSPVSDFDLSFALTELKSQGVVATAKEQEGMVSVW